MVKQLEPLEYKVWAGNWNGQWMTDGYKLWKDKKGETEAQRILTGYSKRSEKKDWSKLYAASSLTNKKGKWWQRLDLQFKTVNLVLGCLITNQNPTHSHNAKHQSFPAPLYKSVQNTL